MQDFLSVTDADANTLGQLLEVADGLKRDRVSRLAAGAELVRNDLSGRSVALVFEKPSLRTRASFEVGVQELGGIALPMWNFEINLGARESIADTGRVLSRYTQCLVIRTFSHAGLEELAEAADVPVINALSDHEHPCQALADLMTVHEAFGDLSGRSLAYVGDGNNVAHSLLLAGALAGMSVRVAHPDGYGPDAGVVEQASALAAEHDGEVVITTDPGEAVADADAVYTDVWASMGQEDEAEHRTDAFAGYQVTSDLMARAADEAIFLHCLPAHRGEEVAADVIDGPASRVFDQAENRLHAQKALMVTLFSQPAGGTAGRG